MENLNHLPNYLNEKIKELAKLEDGWYDGNGVRINRNAIEGLMILLNHLHAFPIMKPYLCPNEDGSISLQINKEHLVVIHIDEISYDLTILYGFGTNLNNKYIYYTHARVEDLVSTLLCLYPGG